MAPTYLADRYGWAYSLDDGSQPKYLLNGAGNFIRQCMLSQSHSDSEKPDRPDTPPRSSPSDNSGSNNLEGSDTSKYSKISRGSTDSGQSINSPATVGWKCYHCSTVNYTDHQRIPFEMPERDAHGNNRRNEQGHLIFRPYPFIPCSGCNGHCTPFCKALLDP